MTVEMDHGEARDIAHGLSAAEAEKTWYGWYERNFGDDFFAPLFDTVNKDVNGTTAQVVKTQTFGQDDRTVLKRNEQSAGKLRNEIRAALVAHAFNGDIEQPHDWLDKKLRNANLRWDTLSDIKEVIKDGSPCNAEWVIGDEANVEKVVKLDEGESINPQGILYLMHTLDGGGRPVPKYIGITRLSNSGGHLNGNFNHHADSKFARWGYGRRQHLGELSCVLFPDEHSWEPEDKYEEWAEDLFVDHTRVLREPVYFTCQMWDGPIEVAEELMVNVASKAFPDEVLNRNFVADSGQSRLGEHV